MKKYEFNVFLPGLYLVPTPIGNIDDITVRALKVLQSADVIVCEDTRVTGSLLKRYGIIPKQLLSLHEHSAEVKAANVAELAKERVVAYCSDAGTPLISDPGGVLVKKAIEAGVRLTPLPGACAAVSALVASGMSSETFTFVGFPPAKKRRTVFLADILRIPTTVILYESPNRVHDLLVQIAELDPHRTVCIAREMTKIHEEFVRGLASECAELFANDARSKGEMVVIVEGRDTNEPSNRETQ